MYVKELPAEDWKQLRETRLRALRESSSSFMSTFQREYGYEEADWAAEFKRGRWWILRDPDDRPSGLIGATRFEGDWYLEYLWVAPDQRRGGLAAQLIRHATSSLASEEGVSSVSLWVLDGNYAAYSLYHRLGFEMDGTVQELEDGTGRKEMRMRGAIPLNEGPRLYKAGISSYPEESIQLF